MHKKIFIFHVDWGHCFRNNRQTILKIVHSDFFSDVSKIEAENTICRFSWQRWVLSKMNKATNFDLLWFSGLLSEKMIVFLEKVTGWKYNLSIFLTIRFIEKKQDAAQFGYQCIFEGIIDTLSARCRSRR